MDLVNSGSTKSVGYLNHCMGLKQASRQWNSNIMEALISRGYSQSKHDYSLTIKKRDGKLSIISICG